MSFILRRHLGAHASQWTILDAGVRNGRFISGCLPAPLLDPLTYLNLSTTKRRRSSSLRKEFYSRLYSCGFSGNSTHYTLRKPFWHSLKRLRTLEIRFGSVIVCSSESGGNKCWFGGSRSNVILSKLCKGLKRSRFTNLVLLGIMRSGKDTIVTLQWCRNTYSRM